MDNADIGFIGGVLGTALGVIGALLGMFLSSKKAIKNILECHDLGNSEKLNKVNEYINAIFYSLIALVVFLVLIGFLIKYVNVVNSVGLYVTLLLTLIFSFQTLYFYIIRKHIKKD